MRIAVFQLDNFQQSPFGKYFVKLAREFRSRGFDVDLLGTSDLGFESLPKDVGRILIGQPRGRLPSHFKGIPQLARYFRNKSPEAVIANTTPFAIAAVIAKIISRSPVKILVNLHIPLSWELNGRMHRIARSYPYILPFVFKHAHQVIAVSNQVADDCAAVTGYPREKIAIQSWAVVTDEDLERASPLA